jgi:membrane protein implicated in regulation of membrane protease activity
MHKYPRPRHPPPSHYKYPKVHMPKFGATSRRKHVSPVVWFILVPVFLVYISYQAAIRIETWWWLAILLILVGIVAAFLVVRALHRSRAAAEERRRVEEAEKHREEKYNRLMAKYGNEKAVNKIMNGEVWDGMTEEQLVDSLGEPIEREEATYKAKIQKTYKYDQTGRNRFGKRFTIEDSVVVGHKSKGINSELPLFEE